MSVGQTQEHEHEVQQENKTEKDDKELQKLSQTKVIVSFQTTDTVYWRVYLI